MVVDLALFCFNTVIGNEISDLERQRIDVQEKKRNLKRREQDEFREQ